MFLTQQAVCSEAQRPVPTPSGQPGVWLGGPGGLTSSPEVPCEPVVG